MAYAAITSLMRTLDQYFLQSEPRLPLPLPLPLKDKQEVVSLYKELGLLQEIIEKSEILNEDPAMKDLEAQIRDVSLETERRIELDLSAIYLAKGWTKRRRRKACLYRLSGILNQAVKQTVYLKKESVKVKNEYHLIKGSSQQRRSRVTNVSLFGSSSSSQPDLERENITVSAAKYDSGMVGCNEEFMMLFDQLTRQSAILRQVISIVGMGGLGKTTLARRVYEDPSVTSYFDKRAWVTVSQEHDMEQMLRCLIGCVSDAAHEQINEQCQLASDAAHEQINEQCQLAHRLYQCLKGWRYLIVIDDIWSTTAWDDVQRCFPDDGNGSRILLTSRLKEVAEYASSGNAASLNMRFLDASESWSLYCKVFGRTEFLSVFQIIGRDIVEKCKGLPLAIIVVASLLSKIEEKVDTWENVAKNLSRVVSSDSNEACSRILSLSYNQLPHHLKACFLYFGVFPEDCEIPVKKLVMLWVAEGLLRAEKHRNEEEVAMECLQDLVDRSLVQVCKQSYNGKIKTLKMHDLLHDLCLREARCENHLNVIGNDCYDDVVRLEELPFHKSKSKSQHLFSRPCRWMRIKPGLINSDRILSNCFDEFHSLHCDYISGSSITNVISRCKLLRAIDLKHGFLGAEELNVFANLVHLRYLASSTKSLLLYSDLHSFEFWNMQSCILQGCHVKGYSPLSRILKMPLLRNFHADQIYSIETPEVVHRNIQTISWLDPMCCTEELFTRTPNLKKLGIMSEISCGISDFFYNLVHLGKLEKLSIKEGVMERIPSSGIQWGTSFLPNLKKLNLLDMLVLPWSDLSLIGMLPNLEVLKLINACKGPKWEPSEGGFRRLKRLVIQHKGLKCWNAVGDDHFPVLECLELRHCISLQEIPSGFADINTLMLIKLSYCLNSLLASARWIQDEQQSYGNDAFLVHSEKILISEDSSEDSSGHESG